MLIAFLTLFLAAATFLVYEILLMKILSLVGWSHYAYMVVSLSMLGLGFSGVMLGLFHNFFLKYRNLFILAGGFAFSLLLPLTFYVNQRLPLNYLYLMWDWRQFIYIGLSYFLYGLPFFLISTILAIFFLKYPEKTNQVYAVNLLGSGFGIFCGIAIMYLAPAELYIFIGSFFSALMSLCWGLNYKGLKKKAAVVAAFAVIILINSLLIPSCLMPYISEYKGLPALLRLPGTEIVDRYYSPMGMLHVLEGDKIRIVSGLSITHRQMPPPQICLATKA